ncbi:isoprenoid synthase domain-containing protein [Crucibulum laeve]|uniref:(2E,6E)-farnesyl diphosphate synthase n=1 Tax=Crucibulum laeve TaxID=68775 RepID=A0A5C3LIP9_9AGAR|nr:isoprenoid synthase domain-containing protein [Crucibulum laeve]
MMSSYDNIFKMLSSDPNLTARNEAALLEPFTYITSQPGKEIRTKLIDAFNTWMNVPTDQLQIIKRVVNMLHAASLLVDDIQDDSQLRRGNPVAHKIYGVPQTINTANYVCFIAFKELFALREKNAAVCPREAVDAIVAEELLCLHRGQGLDILWRDSLHCPEEEEYIGMVNDKTGGMLRIGVRLMMACCTTNIDVDYVPIGNLIAVYFQIRDDLMNLQSQEYNDNKGFAEDLTEGKFSFPVIHSIHANMEDTRVLNVLQRRPTTPTLKKHAISYLKNQTKSFDYTLSVLENLEAQTREEIQRLGGNPGLEKIMDILHVDPAKLS